MAAFRMRHADGQAQLLRQIDRHFVRAWAASSSASQARRRQQFNDS